MCPYAMWENHIFNTPPYLTLLNTLQNRRKDSTKNTVAVDPCSYMVDCFHSNPRLHVYSFILLCVCVFLYMFVLVCMIVLCIYMFVLFNQCVLLLCAVLYVWSLCTLLYLLNLFMLYVIYISCTCLSLRNIFWHFCMCFKHVLLCVLFWLASMCLIIL